MSPPKPVPPIPVSDARGLYLTADLLGALALDPSRAVSIQDLVVATRTPPPTTLMGSELFLRNELFSSRKYAAWIHAAFQENLLFLPAIRRRSVPGYDGVIYDAKMRPIANYTLKNATDDALESQIAEGIEKANRYSRLSEWVPWAQRTPISGVLRSTRPDCRAGDRVQVSRAFLDAGAWLNEAWSYLGVGGPSFKDNYGARPYRLVVDVSDYKKTMARDSNFFDALQAAVRSEGPPLQSVVLLLGPGAFVVKADRFDYFDLPSGP